MVTRADALYVDIWERLKLHRKCRVAVCTALQRRIIHAVVNKKYYDLAYKLQLAESKQFAKIVYVTTKNEIHFTLLIHNRVNQLTEDDI